MLKNVKKFKKYLIILLEVISAMNPIFPSWWGWGEGSTRVQTVQEHNLHQFISRSKMLIFQKNAFFRLKILHFNLLS
jgi:hypothetical protein